MSLDKVFGLPASYYWNDKEHAFFRHRVDSKMRLESDSI